MQLPIISTTGRERGGNGKKVEIISVIIYGVSKLFGTPFGEVNLHKLALNGKIIWRNFNAESFEFKVSYFKRRWLFNGI